MFSCRNNRKIFLAEYNIRSNLQKLTGILYFIPEKEPLSTETTRIFHHFLQCQAQPLIKVVDGLTDFNRIAHVHALTGHAAITGVVTSYICASTNLVRSDTTGGKEQQYVF